MTNPNQLSKSNKSESELKEWHSPKLRVLEITEATKSGGTSGPTETAFYTATS